MRALIQRVKEANVSVNDQICGKIGSGLTVFFGVHRDDTPEKTDWLVKKLVGLRIFSDAEGKMNNDIVQAKGDVLVISQFTLYGNCQSGKRPAFSDAALPEPAFLLYEQFIQELSQELGRKVETGIFGARMQVNLVNDGPVTFLLER